MKSTFIAKDENNGFLLIDVLNNGQLAFEVENGINSHKRKQLTIAELYGILFDDNHLTKSQLIKCESDKAYWQSQHSSVSNLAQKYEEKILELGRIISRHESLVHLNNKTQEELRKENKGLKAEIETLKKSLRPTISPTATELRISIEKPWCDYPYTSYICIDDTKYQSYLYPDGTWHAACGDEGRFRSLNKMFDALAASGKNYSVLEKKYPAICVSIGTWHSIVKGAGFYCFQPFLSTSYLDITGKFSEFDVRNEANWWFATKEEILEKLNGYRWYQ